MGGGRGGGGWGGGGGGGGGGWGGGWEGGVGVGACWEGLQLPLVLANRPLADPGFLGGGTHLRQKRVQKHLGVLTTSGHASHHGLLPLWAEAQALEARSLPYERVLPIFMAGSRHCRVVFCPHVKLFGASVARKLSKFRWSWVGLASRDLGCPKASCMPRFLKLEAI